jgi:ATP-dependent exoDNAse (exonuclease V) beta subunit
MKQKKKTVSKSKSKKEDKKEEIKSRTKKNNESEDNLSDHEEEEEDDDDEDLDLVADDEIDTLEYHKFLSKLFPSRYINNKIKAGKKIKESEKEESNSDEEEDSEEDDSSFNDEELLKKKGKRGKGKGGKTRKKLIYSSFQLVKRIVNMMMIMKRTMMKIYGKTTIQSLMIRIVILTVMVSVMEQKTKMNL